MPMRISDCAAWLTICAICTGPVATMGAFGVGPGLGESPDVAGGAPESPLGATGVAGLVAGSPVAETGTAATVGCGKNGCAAVGEIAGTGVESLRRDSAPLSVDPELPWSVLGEASCAGLGLVLSAVVLPLDSGPALAAAGAVLADAAEAVEETDGANIPVREAWNAASKGTPVSSGADTSSERSMLTAP